MICVQVRAKNPINLLTGLPSSFQIIKKICLQMIPSRDRSIFVVTNTRINKDAHVWCFNQKSVNSTTHPPLFVSKIWIKPTNTHHSLTGSIWNYTRHSTRRFNLDDPTNFYVADAPNFANHLATPLACHPPIVDDGKDELRSQRPQLEQQRSR